MNKLLITTFITICHNLSASAQAEIDLKDLAELQCWLYADYGIFRLIGLEKTGN